MVTMTSAYDAYGYDAYGCKHNAYKNKRKGYGFDDGYDFNGYDSGYNYGYKSYGGAAMTTATTTPMTTTATARAMGMTTTSITICRNVVATDTTRTTTHRMTTATAAPANLVTATATAIATYFGYESAASSAGADGGEKESATVSTDAAKQSKTELEVSRTPPKSRKESEESELCEKSSRRGKANQNPRGVILDRVVWSGREPCITG
ncbi:hypothetical protein PC123_g21710 [Phytophthora cactorum]|nr:hypothetical protein PC123_g21710 [Phytophthora cactorum]